MTEKEKYVLEHYEITRNGEIYSTLNSNSNHNRKLLKLRTDKDGYYDVALVYNEQGDRMPFRVHRLVALKYLANPNNYPVVNHKDSIKSNNNVDNLEWCTISYNTQHYFDHQKENLPHLKVTHSDGRVEIFPTVSYASRYFGYTNPTTLEHIAKSKRIPKWGKLKGARIEYTQESVTTIERNTSTVTGV